MAASSARVKIICVLGYSVTNDRANKDATQVEQAVAAGGREIRGPSALHGVAVHV